MSLNSSTMQLFHNILMFNKGTLGKDHVKEIEENFDGLVYTFQTISDFDLENDVQLMLWTVFQTTDSPMDDHTHNTVNFIQKCSIECHQMYGGNFEEYFTQLINGNVTSDEDTHEEKVEDTDLIPDEVYGEVDPEDVSYLNQLLKL